MRWTSALARFLLAAPARLSPPLVTPQKFAPRLQICNLTVGQGGFSPPTIRRMPVHLAQAHALVAQYVELHPSLSPSPQTSRQKRVLEFAKWLAGCSSPFCSSCPLSLPLQLRQGTARTRRHLHRSTWVTMCISTPLRDMAARKRRRPMHRLERTAQITEIAAGVTPTWRSSARRPKSWRNAFSSVHSLHSLWRSSALEQSRTSTAPNGHAPAKPGASVPFRAKFHTLTAAPDSLSRPMTGEFDVQVYRADRAVDHGIRKRSACSR